jgi:hypothetical protein
MSTKPELIDALVRLGETQAPTTLKKRSIPWLEERLAARQAEASAAAPPPMEGHAADVVAGETVRLLDGAPAVRVLEVTPDLQRTLRLRLDGPLPFAILEQRYTLDIGGAPDEAAEGAPVLVPLGGTKAVAVARQALSGVLPGVLHDDHLAVKASNAADVLRALDGARSHVNQYGQTWVRLLSRQVAAAFPDAAPPAPERKARQGRGADATARVDAVVAQMHAARARKEAHARVQVVPA